MDTCREVNIGIGSTDNWGGYDEKRETDLTWY